MKKKSLVTILLALFLFMGGIPVLAQSTNYAKSTEILEVKYNGYIQFKPSYKVPKKAGYGLKAGKYVKRAYINYTRNGKSVIGGRKYTATKTSGNSIVSTSATCWDSPLWGNKHTTKFNYGWVYR
ncbi:MULTISPECIES: hypothetical protein [Heyndrickxia]|jgi:hypothetical protein|uniref:hypothetical protein n=1 Tax=Heyndrickxia TaxID=2837504 RepID=UPI002E24D399|nr:hypothetical protein [Heyndrickxia coagulans]